MLMDTDFAPGFLLKFVSVQMSMCAHACVCVCVCVCSLMRLLITSGVMWCNIPPYDWLNKFYGFI